MRWNIGGKFMAVKFLRLWIHILPNFYFSNYLYNEFFCCSSKSDNMIIVFCFCFCCCYYRLSDSTVVLHWKMALRTRLVQRVNDTIIPINVQKCVDLHLTLDFRLESRVFHRFVRMTATKFSSFCHRLLVNDSNAHGLYLF